MGLILFDNGHLFPSGRTAHLAPQQERGLLSEQWIGTGRGGFTHVGSHGSVLNDNPNAADWTTDEHDNKSEVGNKP